MQDRMEQKNKYTIGIIVALSIILIVLMAQGVIKLPSGKFLALFGEGLTINSMSPTNVISQDTDLRGVWWLINAYTGGGQSLAGTLTPEDTKQLSGYTTQYPLTISASAVDQKVEYLMKNTGDNVNYFSYALQTSDGWTGTECQRPALTWNLQWKYHDAPACPTGTQYQIPLEVKETLFGIHYICYRFCINTKQTGVLSVVEPSRFTDSLDITLNARGEEIKKRLTQDTPNADFYSSSLGLVAQVQFPASGWTGNFPPSGQAYRGYYDLSDPKWRITNTARVDNYKSTFTSVDTTLRNWANANYVILDTPLTFLNKVKNEINLLTPIISSMRTDDMSLSQTSVWFNRYDINTGKLIIDLDRQIGVANLVFKVRADWLGIVINVGKPSIVGKTCNAFRSGDTGKIDVQVMNTGSAIGSFVGSVSCGTIKQSYTSSPVSISPQETKTISIPIDAGTFTGDKYDNCEIRVQDFNKASNYDTDTISCHILPPALCGENEFYNENNCIKKCVSGAKKQLKCCEVGQNIAYDESQKGNEFGGYYCQSLANVEICNNGIDDDKDGLIDSNDPDCKVVIQTCKSCDEFALSKIGLKQCKPAFLQNMFTCSFSFIKLAGVVLVFLFGILFGKGLFSSFEAIRDKEWLAWILSIIVAGILAYLVFALFWLGIIIFIIFIIAQVIIKLFLPTKYLKALGR